MNLFSYANSSHTHPLSSSFTSITNKTNPFPYPPPILVKHPIWFLDNADLFLSHREALFGFHRDMFPTTYFSNILTTIEPGQIAARGTIPSLPILCNDISRPTII